MGAWNRAELELDRDKVNPQQPSLSRWRKAGRPNRSTIIDARNLEDGQKVINRKSERN